MPDFPSNLELMWSWSKDSNVPGKTSSRCLPKVHPKVSSHANKRRFLRHRISYPIEMRDDRGGGVPMHTNASDIGGRGCYVETLVPFPLGTPVHISFWIGEEKISTAAMVRASDPGVGMGIEFIGLAEEKQIRFQAHLDEIDPPRVPPT